MEGLSGGTMIDYSIPYAMENRNTAEESYQIYIPQHRLGMKSQVCT